LVLRAGRDAPVDGEVRAERFDLRLAQFAGVSPGVADLVEADELVDPAPIGFLGVEGVMEEAELVADVIVELHSRTSGWGG
jgi:hypothetical protein